MYIYLVQFWDYTKTGMLITVLCTTMGWGSGANNKWKCKHSYRRADPRHQQHLILLVNVWLWPWHLTFYLIFLAQLPASMDYICTNFGVGSSCRLPVRTRMHRHKCSWSAYLTAWLPSAWDEWLACIWQLLMRVDISPLIWPHFVLTESWVNAVVCCSRFSVHDPVSHGCNQSQLTLSR